MRLIIFSVSLFFILPILKSQDSLSVNLSSPYDAVLTHLHFLQESSYDVEKAAAPFRIFAKTKEEAEEKAIQLKQVLDGEGYFINMEEIPKSANYYDSTLHKKKFILISNYPNIYLVKSGDQWVYSRNSLRNIQQVHDTVFPFGIDKLLILVPKMGTREIMGLYMYQYLGVLILIFISILIHRIFTFLFERILLNALLKTGYAKLADRFLLPVAKPISLFFVTLLLVVFIPVLQLPPSISQYFMLFLRAILPLFGTIVFYRIVDVISMYLHQLALKTTSTLDDQLVPLVRKTLKTFVVVVGTLFILANLNIPIIPLLTGLSIGGLAFALAAQDTIKNFFGSLMIFIDKPFQIGDWVTSGEIDGSVEEVGFRSSRIRTFRNSLMYVPNGKLADSTIDNHGMRQYRRFYTQIAVTYDTPPELINTFVEGLRKIVENHPNTRKDYYNIYFNDMASFSLNIMFYIFFEVPTWSEELKARHEVLIEIMKLGKELGVNFAFPTQTLHMENFPGKESLSPSYESPDALNNKLNQLFEKK
jgi:MscS family membrane protein